MQKSPANNQTWLGLHISLQTGSNECKVSGAMRAEVYKFAQDGLTCYDNCTGARKLCCNHMEGEELYALSFSMLNTSGFCKMAAINSGFLSLSGWCMSKPPSVTHLQCQVSAWLGLANGTAKLGNGLILRPHMATKPKSWLGIGRKWYSVLLSPNLKLST